MCPGFTGTNCWYGEISVEPEDASISFTRPLSGNGFRGLLLLGKEGVCLKSDHCFLPRSMIIDLASITSNQLLSSLMASVPKIKSKGLVSAVGEPRSPESKFTDARLPSRCVICEKSVTWFSAGES